MNRLHAPPESAPVLGSCRAAVVGRGAQAQDGADDVVAHRLHGTGHETVVALEVARAGGQGVEVGEQVRVALPPTGFQSCIAWSLSAAASCVDMLAPPRPNGERLRPKDETPRQALLNKWLRPIARSSDDVDEAARARAGTAVELFADGGDLLTDLGDVLLVLAGGLKFCVREVAVNAHGRGDNRSLRT